MQESWLFSVTSMHVLTSSKQFYVLKKQKPTLLWLACICFLSLCCPVSEDAKKCVCVCVSWDQFLPLFVPPLFHSLGVKTDGINACTGLRQVYYVSYTQFGLHLSHILSFKSHFLVQFQHIKQAPTFILFAIFLLGFVPCIESLYS